MSAHKNILALALFCSLALSICNTSVSAAAKKHDLVVGARVWGDYQLQREIVKVDYSWFRINKHTQTFTGDGASIITYIRVLDQATDGKGGSAVIVTGGTGNNFVTLKFTSQRSQKIDFIVELYGRKAM